MLRGGRCSYHHAPQVPGIAAAVIYQPSVAVASFDFDAGGSRAKQVLTRTYVDQSRSEAVTRYLGSYETEDHGSYTAAGVYTAGKSIQRHQLGSALYVREIPASGPEVIRLGMVLTDHLGSTDVIVRADWDAANNRWKTSYFTDPALSEPRGERQSFDPWGERRDLGWQTLLHTSDTSNRRTSAMDYDRGFTGHEMLDDFALIHMNGRIYDPEIGRFLSPDPYVQVPEYSQNFNRYTYVLNNPLSHTDSSGNEIDGLVVAAISIVVGIVTLGIGSALVGAYGGALLVGAGGKLTWLGAMAVGAFSGAAVGATSAALTDQNVLEGALEGAISGAISGGILHGIGTGELLSTLGEYSRTVAHIAGHGILGGVRSEVMGGRFMDGFLSAAAGASAGFIPGLDGVMKAAGNGDPVGMFYRSMIAGAIGGTAAAIGGGKFANGAFTAAFQHLLNEELPSTLSPKPRVAWLVPKEFAAEKGKGATFARYIQQFPKDLPKGSEFLGIIYFDKPADFIKAYDDNGLTYAIVFGHGQTVRVVNNNNVYRYQGPPANRSFIDPEKVVGDRNIRLATCFSGYSRYALAQTYYAGGFKENAAGLILVNRMQPMVQHQTLMALGYSKDQAAEMTKSVLRQDPNTGLR